MESQVLSETRKPPPEEDPLPVRLEEAEAGLRLAFADCSDIVFRELQLSSFPKGLLVYAEGLVKTEELNGHVLRPLLFEGRAADDLPVSDTKKACTCQEVIRQVLQGSAVLLRDGSPEALVLSVAGGERRSIQEPSTEAAIRGPREGFNESLQVSLSLVRLRVRTPRMKTVSYSIGEQTRTGVILSYIEGIANPSVVDEVKERLARIRIDSVLESGYIEEWIEDNPYSPFPQLHYSERPDTVAAQLLEGRFAIFVDGTPFVIMGPVTAWHMMQASEDYYERFLIGSFIRWLRYVFVFIALFLPAVYIAVTTFHQDMLPTTLILSIAAAREVIPFPALVEALIMEIAFEALREAGIRLPKTIGQTVSILGALVIGQAAVQAGIVSAPMVIIVSLTGIASFCIPRFNFAISIRMLRFPMMFMAGAFGIFGMSVASVLILCHMCNLRSFGVPYLSGIAPYQPDNAKDVFVRVPWWNMLTRPAGMNGSQGESRRSVRRRLKPPETW
ncbi:spore germination protein [Paenibacillus caseinilyticus]